VAPRPEVLDADADLFDVPCRLMSEHHRKWPRPRTVDHGQVRVAEAGGTHAHEQLSSAGRVEVDLRYVERAGLLVGTR